MGRLLEVVGALLTFIVMLRALRIAVKGFSDLFRPSGTAPPAGAKPREAPRPIAEELKKDPVCGTFIAPSSAVRKMLGGETYYFCSAQCRDKFRGPEVRRAV
jgi:YHS domain-containing protein